MEEQDIELNRIKLNEMKNLFTKNYFIGLGVGLLVGYMVLPKVLKKNK